MKFMVVWKTVPGKYKTALDQFLKIGLTCAGRSQDAWPLARSRVNAWVAPDRNQ